MVAQFEYLRPESREALLSLLVGGGEDTYLYGGGTDLLVLLRAGIIQARRLIDTKGVAEFCTVTESPGQIAIGCAVTHSQLRENALVRRWAPALAAAAGKVGSIQIQNKGTLAGNIQTASPAGDALNVAWAMDATVVLLSAVGERRIPLRQFVQGPRRTQLCEGELIAAVEIPKRAWTYQNFFKVGRRNALAISVVNGVVAIQSDRGLIQDVRISLGAVGPTPLQMTEAEALLRGRRLNEIRLPEVEEAVRRNVSPISDLRAGAEYRAYIAGVMVKRELEVFLKEMGI